MKCYIIDDIYGKEIYNGLKIFLPKLTYPIKTNVLEPLEYVDKIKDEDIILLDNFFPIPNGREEHLWAIFLDEIIKRDIHPKIICISDFWEKLIEKFDARRKGYEVGIVVGFVPTKNPKDIAEAIKKILSIT